MKTISAYQCSFCTFYRKTKRIVSNHENICFRNPKTKSCATCKHNSEEYHTVYNPHHGGDPGSTDYEERYNWCEARGVALKKGTLTTNCGLWKPTTN